MTNTQCPHNSRAQSRKFTDSGMPGVYYYEHGNKRCTVDQDQDNSDVEHLHFAQVEIVSVGYIIPLNHIVQAGSITVYVRIDLVWFLVVENQWSTG